ncbi:MAG: hypothetical protein R2849_01465 [Thermomicrobiales bacterium]
MMPIIAATLAACTGPDDRDDVDATATIEDQSTIVIVTATPSEDQAAREPTATEEPEATPTVSPTPSPTQSPTPEPPTATPEPTATATALPLSLSESLPREDQLPAEGFFLANQGTRSALELANSYQDSSAHLERLDNWGFKEHLFREYGHESAGPDDTTPTYLLTTVNEYGSDEQGAEALEWLRSLNSSQGQTFVEPDPDLGDAAFASSVLTADGSESAIVYVLIGPRVYAYFAQGGEPLDFALQLATENTARIEEAG